MKFANKKTTKLSNDFWKILVVDDEEEVHSITNIVLRNFTFENKKVKLFDAYNINETKELLKNETDFALILLDIVMETDDAGLTLTKYIREELNNHTSRIILRTGQPGSAPEQQIIVDYDINDYKEKTELSATKLATSVISSLRSYNELIKIKKLKELLETEIEDNIEELKNRNDLIQNKIVSMNNPELMYQITHQLKEPFDEIKFGLNELDTKIGSKEFDPNYLKEEVGKICTKIEELSAKIDKYETS